MSPEEYEDMVSEERKTAVSFLAVGILIGYILCFALVLSGII